MNEPPPPQKTFTLCQIYYICYDGDSSYYLQLNLMFGHQCSYHKTVSQVFSAEAEKCDQTVK